MINLLIAAYMLQVIVVVVLLGLQVPGEKIFESKRDFCQHLIPFMYISRISMHLIKRYNSLD